MSRRIYTGTGDTGETGLMAGVRVAKDSDQIEAVGCVDELNSAIGLTLLCITDPLAQSILLNAQRTLFSIGAAIAMPRDRGVDLQPSIEALESAIDHIDANLPPLRRFILPGGSEQSARTHWARSVCRRTERSLVRSNRTVPLPPANLVYLNRLSDYLFVLARQQNHIQGIPDPEWVQEVDKG